MRWPLVGCAAILFLVAGNNIAPAVPIGITIDASTQVVGSGGGGKRLIHKDSPVFSDDRLRANRTGNAQIVLKDNTRMVVGPNAQVTIDDFVFATDTTFQKITVRATKGAFRFISGRSGHDAYTIETPTGTIGVRGTSFDVAIEPGRTHVTVVRGAVEMCPNGGRCDTISGWCSYGVMSNSQINELGSLRTRSVNERELFALMQDERQLRNQFRHFGPSCASAMVTVPNTPTFSPTRQVPQPTFASPAPQAPQQPGQPAPDPKGNKSGLGDGTNPGKGSHNNNSGNQGTNNPGHGKGRG
jgi:FecR protein